MTFCESTLAGELTRRAHAGASFLSGLSEPIGGLVVRAYRSRHPSGVATVRARLCSQGWLLMVVLSGGNDISPLAYGIMFGIVTGMMVYIVLAHLLPAAHRYDPNDTVCTPCVTVGMVRRADRGPHTLRASLISLACSQVVMAASLMMFMA